MPQSPNPPNPPIPQCRRFIGIGIKLALYDVDAPADAFFAHDQKLLLGGSCAACFMLTEMMYAHTPCPLP
jgi:hypothetical protein